MSSLKLSPLSTPKTKKPLIATTVFFPTFQFYLILSPVLFNYIKMYHECAVKITAHSDGRSLERLI